MLQILQISITNACYYLRMRELEFLNIIKKSLFDSSYLGNDCAFLEELGIYVTQDTLVEGTHFLLQFSKPFEIGYKSVMVNLSDLASAFSKPKYIFVSLSLPKNIGNEFVYELYKGINSACEKYDVIVAGGDITSSEKVVVSICAIGKKVFKFNVGRNYAKKGDVIVTTGVHGSSALGLNKLLNNCDKTDFFIQKHLFPNPKIHEILKIGEFINENIATMDSSDGLADSLYKIADASNVSINVNFNDIPIDNGLKSEYNYKDLVLYGGEDYEVVFSLNYELFDYIKTLYPIYKIGEIVKKNIEYKINIDNELYINEAEFLKKTFNHFEEQS